MPGLERQKRNDELGFGERIRDRVLDNGFVKEESTTQEVQIARWHDMRTLGYPLPVDVRNHDSRKKVSFNNRSLLTLFFLVVTFPRSVMLTSVALTW